MEKKIEVGIERKCGVCQHFDECGKYGNGRCSADCIIGGKMVSAIQRCWIGGHFKPRKSVYEHLSSVHGCKVSDLKVVFI